MAQNALLKKKLRHIHTLLKELRHTNALSKVKQHVCPTLKPETDEKISNFFYQKLTSTNTIYGMKTRTYTEYIIQKLKEYNKLTLTERRRTTYKTEFITC